MYYTFLIEAIEVFHLMFDKRSKPEVLFEPFTAKLSRIDSPKSYSFVKVLEFCKRNKERGYQKPENVSITFFLAEVSFTHTDYDPINKVSLKMDAYKVELEWGLGEDVGGDGKKDTLPFLLPESLKDVESIMDHYITQVYAFADAYDTDKKQKGIKNLLKLTGSVTDKGNELCMAFIKKNGEAALKSILLCPFENMGFSELLVKKLKEEAGKDNLLEVLHIANINDFQKFKKFGTKPAKELREFLEKNELDFGMFSQ